MSRNPSRAAVRTRAWVTGAAALAALTIGCGSGEEPSATAPPEPFEGAPAAAAPQLEEPLEDLDELAVEESAVQAAPAVADVEPPDLPEVSAPPPPRTHTVARGETLRLLAERYYGDRDRATEIYEANRATLSDPNLIRPGQVLTIP